MSWALKTQNREKHLKQRGLNVFHSPVKIHASRRIKGLKVFFYGVHLASKNNELNT
jgi:hypothetical protein